MKGRICRAAVRVFRRVGRLGWKMVKVEVWMNRVFWLRRVVVGCFGWLVVGLVVDWADRLVVLKAMVASFVCRRCPAGVRLVRAGRWREFGFDLCRAGRMGRRRVWIVWRCWACRVGLFVLGRWARAWVCLVGVVVVGRARRGRWGCRVVGNRVGFVGRRRRVALAWGRSLGGAGLRVGWVGWGWVVGFVVGLIAGWSWVDRLGRWRVVLIGRERGRTCFVVAGVA